MVQSYFMASDLLGFSSIVSNLDQDKLNERINAWIVLAKKIKSEMGIRDMQLISDTLFVREEDSKDGLGRLLQFAKSLLERGIERSFPIRGAITYGDVIWGDLTYGKPVIEAHQLEMSLDLIGIACSPKLPRIKSFYSWNLVCVYPAPKQTGMIQLVPVVVWSVPEPDKLVSKTSAGGHYKSGDHILWEHHSKVERTVLFAKYLHHANQARLDPQDFKYKTPAHFIGDLK